MLNHNLEYYRTFYFVSKFSSITKASGALHISQPAVSRSIQELENSLKTTLFKRLPRGMVLTPEGRHLFAHVEAAFEHLLAGEHELQQYRQHMEGTIQIAATETALYYFFLDKVESFKTLNPHVSFQISGSSTADTISMLREGRVDFAMAVSPVENPGDLTVVPVKTFQDIFVAGQSFIALKDKGISAEEIVKHPIIAVEKGTSARTLIDLWFGEQGIFFIPTISVRTSTTVIPFVERNLGIGILPRPFAESAIQNGKIFEIHLNKPLYNREIMIIHLGNTSLLGEKFLKHLLAEEG